MELNSLLSAAAALPSQPRTVALLMSELAHAEPSLWRANQLFAADPALAARLLTLANAPASGQHRMVQGIAQALALVDVEQLRSLVRMAAPLATSRALPGIDLPHFWRYSHDTARFSRSLAALVHADATAAYTAGLLHGLGELIIHAVYSDKVQAISRVVAPLEARRAKIEKRMLGVSYAMVGAALMRHWQLPEAVCDAIGHQHAPFENKVCEPLAAVLHLAAWRARAHHAGMNDKELAVTFPAEVALVLDLDIDMVLQQDPIDWQARPEFER